MRHCILFAAFMLISQVVSAGDFDGARLLFDAQSEDNAENNTVRTLPLLAAGTEFEVQVFVSDQSGFATKGFDIALERMNGDFGDLFEIVSATAFDGAALTISGNSVTALLISAPSIPSSGHLATITLRTVAAVPETDAVLIRSATIIDGNTRPDPLDLTQGSIVFTQSTYVEGVLGDLDRNGEVNFSDFIVFAQNYGKTGPVPSDPLAIAVAPAIITVRDTLVQTRRDTIFETIRDTLVQTVHDTVIVSMDPFGVIPVVNPISAPQLIAGQFVIALDADAQPGYQNAYATNGVEIEIYARSGADNHSAFTILLEYDHTKLEYRDFLKTSTEDNGVIAGMTALPGTRPALNQIKIDMTRLGGGNTSLSTGSFGKIRFRRTQKGDAAVRLIEIIGHQGNLSHSATIHNDTVTLTWP